MKRADIKIGFLCNNSCKFCVQGEKRNIFGNKKEDEIKKNLREAKKNNLKGITFTGGEPTIHDSFLELVSYAKFLGFKTIQVQTNGRLFAYKDFCKKTIRAGVTEFSPALHGHNAKIHDFLTGSAGSFEQTLEGIKNLKELSQIVLTNTVVTSKNYKFLPQIARLLVGLGVDQFQFAFVHLGGQAWKNRKWICPKKKDVMPYVKKGLDVGIKAKKIVMTEAIPYCLMGGYENYIAEKIIPDTTVYDSDFVIKDYTLYRQNEGKLKREDCKKCKYYRVCEGPWKEYPQLFGWKEFLPRK
ncbi:MAG: radical SAM protein [Candidatus Pacebacteria bacterium]|nr:radical SAM protein [Candidatus Paceibacterota bacterium]